MNKLNDIDLSLPITSTYLRRMRALGMATNFEQAYNQQQGLLVSHMEYIMIAPGTIYMF